jgi:hypothetical protein
LSDRYAFLDGRKTNAMRWIIDLKNRGLLLFVNNKVICGSNLVLTAEMFQQKQINSF